MSFSGFCLKLENFPGVRYCVDVEKAHTQQVRDTILNRDMIVLCDYMVECTYLCTIFYFINVQVRGKAEETEGNLR